MAAAAIGGTASAEPSAAASTVVPGVLAAATAPARLTWAPPPLTAPTTIALTSANRDVTLDPARDYVLTMPSSPLVGVGGLMITGGHNVVLIGGEVQIPAGTPAGNGSRGLYLKGQTGTIHIEGLRISGSALTEGIDLDERLGAIVQLANVRLETVNGSASGAHADILQTWAGPRKLLIDGLTGSTTYQGMFLLPKQFGTQAQPELFDFRRVDLRGSATSGYMVWRDSLTWPLTVTNMWVAPKTPTFRDGFLWPRGTGPATTAWPSIQVGTPPAGVFVPVGTAGTAYVSPGYVGVTPPPVVVRSPIGSLDTVAAATGGLRVRGWAADRDTTAALFVDITVAGVTRRVTANLARPDVTAVYPDLRPSTGFDAVIPLPLGSHAVCAVAVNVGSGSNKSLGCRTATVLSSSTTGTTTPTATATTPADSTAPTFASAPSVLLRTGVISTAGAVPVTAAWSATDAVGVVESRITSPVQASFGPGVAVGDTAVGTGYASWAVAAIDRAGNVAVAAASRTITWVPETTATRTDYWWTQRDVAMGEGQAIKSNRRGASTSYALDGTGVAWVASKDATSGRATVSVDGVVAGTVDLGATTAAHRQVVFARNWATAGHHTITVVVEGTSGRPNVMSDGFVTIS